MNVPDLLVPQADPGAGYRAQKVESQLSWLLANGYGDATHIFYTDCCDCLMLAPPEEIERKYRAMGCPPMHT